MCEWGTSREVTIERRLNVDACIADKIVELNRQGIYTTGCCCGHGKAPATATILPSSQERARELGFEVTYAQSGDPQIEIADICHADALPDEFPGDDECDYDDEVIS